MAGLISLLLLFSCNGNEEKILLFPVSDGKAYKYIDREGNSVAAPKFVEASAFRENVALVKFADTIDRFGKYGFINTNGKYIISPLYKSATIFQEGVAWVVLEDGAPTAMSKSGNVLFVLKRAKEVHIFNEGLAAFSSGNNELWGFVLKNGQIKIKAQFKAASDFKEGKCAVADKDGKYGYINVEGKFVIKPRFDQALDFKDGKAIVCFNGKEGLIDSKGKFIIEPQYDEIVANGDIFLINHYSKWGWCNGKGKMLINPQFDNAAVFSCNELARIKRGDDYGYINKDGAFTINPQFSFATPFNGDLALAGSDNKIGLINMDGKYIVNPQFARISPDLAVYLNEAGTRYNKVITDYNK